MKKQFFRISMILGFALLLCLFIAPTKAQAATSGTCGENLTWKVEGWTLTISGNGPMSDYDYWDQDWASELPYIKKVVINNGVTTIGSAAFAYCENLISVSIPESVTSIGDGAFSGCGALSSVTIPKSVTFIHNEAFTFTEGLTGIWVDEDNPNYMSDAKGCLLTKDQTFFIQAPAKLSGSYTIPNGVTEINYKAFAYSTDLTAVVVPNSVITIGEEAFYVSTGLVSVTLGKNVASIGDYAFEFCESLGGIWVNSANAYYSSDSYGCLFNKNKTEFLMMPYGFSGAYTIPSTVTKIYDYAFSGRMGLTYITIPNSVSSIGEYAFDFCSRLTSVTIPGSLRSMGDSAFAGCGLKSVTIQSGATVIGNYAFGGCTDLTYISIPSSVTSIGSYAFAGTGWFENQPDGMVYAGKVAYAYKGNCPSQMQIKAGTLGIARDAFSECASLTSVTIPSSVVHIEMPVFDCPNLAQIKIDPANKAFCNDENGLVYNKAKTKLIAVPSILLEDCVIADTVTHIGKFAFYGCNSLNIIALPDSVTSIEESAFFWCRGLETVIIGKGVSDVGEGAFSGCDGLKTVLYTATEADWSRIRFEAGNEQFSEASIHYEAYNTTNCVNTGWFCPDCDTFVVRENAVDGTHSYTGACDEECDVCETARVTTTSHTYDGACDRICNICAQGRITDTAHSFGGNELCTICGEPDWLKGDYDDNGIIDNKDVEYLLWHTLFPEDYPLPGAGDLTGDGSVDNKDVEYLLWHTLFPEDYPLTMVPAKKKEF